MYEQIMKLLEEWFHENLYEIAAKDTTIGYFSIRGKLNSVIDIFFPGEYYPDRVVKHLYGVDGPNRRAAANWEVLFTRRDRFDKNRHVIMSIHSPMFFNDLKRFLDEESA